MKALKHGAKRIDEGGNVYVYDEKCGVWRVQSNEESGNMKNNSVIEVFFLLAALAAVAWFFSRYVNWNLLFQ